MENLDYRQLVSDGFIQLLLFLMHRFLMIESVTECLGSVFSTVFEKSLLDIGYSTLCSLLARICVIM
jgi:hypothetical protein